MSNKCPCPKRPSITEKDCCPPVTAPGCPTCEHPNHNRAKEIFEKYPCESKRRPCPGLLRRQEEQPKHSRAVAFSLDECSKCPTAQSLMQSVRLQEIMMQKMWEQMKMTRQTFRGSIKPTQRTRDSYEEKSRCTGDVDIIEEMLCELCRELEETKLAYERYQKCQEKKRKEEQKNKKCICGRGNWS